MTERKHNCGCIHCVSNAEVIKVWGRDWDVLNKWLAVAHPELNGDPARTPWGILCERLEAEENKKSPETI